MTSIKIFFEARQPTQGEQDQRYQQAIQRIQQASAPTAEQLAVIDAHKASKAVEALAKDAARKRKKRKAVTEQRQATKIQRLSSDAETDQDEAAVADQDTPAKVAALRAAEEALQFLQRLDA